jgi:hypothetical protein
VGNTGAAVSRLLGLGRLLFLIAFALFAVQAGGLAMAVEVPCAEPCEGDGPDGQCPPACYDCACCAQPRAHPTVFADEPLIAPPMAPAAWPTQSEPATPDPREILRVPKRA